MHPFLTLRLSKTERVIVGGVLVPEVHSLLRLAFCGIPFFRSKGFTFKSFRREGCDAKSESEPMLRTRHRGRQNLRPR